MNVSNHKNKSLCNSIVALLLLPFQVLNAHKIELPERHTLSCAVAVFKFGSPDKEWRLTTSFAHFDNLMITIKSYAQQENLLPIFQQFTALANPFVSCMQQYEQLPQAHETLKRLADSLQQFSRELNIGAFIVSEPSDKLHDILRRIIAQMTRALYRTRRYEHNKKKELKKAQRDKRKAHHKVSQNHKKERRGWFRKERPISQ